MDIWGTFASQRECKVEEYMGYCPGWEGAFASEKVKSGEFFGHMGDICEPKGVQG